jgi:kinase-associated protein B
MTLEYRLGIETSMINEGADKNMTADLQPEQIVQFTYKSGEYIGRIHELRTGKAVIEVMAVLKHPKQGDLHHHRRPGEPSMFHQRKALAQREKALVPLPFIKPYDGEVPNYVESLRAALHAEIAYLRGLGDDAYAQQALAHLAELERDYAVMYQY